MILRITRVIEYVAWSLEVKISEPWDFFKTRLNAYFIKRKKFELQGAKESLAPAVTRTMGICLTAINIKEFKHIQLTIAQLQSSVCL
jgi:hypothetical protein